MIDNILIRMLKLLLNVLSKLLFAVSVWIIQRCKILCKLPQRAEIFSSAHI